MDRSQELAMLRRLHTLETESNEAAKQQEAEAKQQQEEEKRAAMDP